jgi:hypothetical protein
MTTCDPSLATDFGQMELPGLTLSQGASPARTYLSLAVERDLKVLAADYGQKSFALLANYDPNTSSWRTSQTSLVALANSPADGLAEFSEIWPRSGLMRSGTAYQLPLSALHMVETGCGFWPTPNKSNGFAPFSMLTMLRKQSGKSRPSGVKMGFDLKWEPRCVPYLVDGWINPNLAEWLMGFPIGHTALPPAETP